MAYISAFSWRKYCTSGILLGQTQAQAPHSIQSARLWLVALSCCCPLLNQYNCCGRRSAGQASAQALQRIQPFSSSGSPISLAEGASRQLVILTTGTSSQGRVKPISGPPIITIGSAPGQKPASFSRWLTGVPRRAQTLPGRVTASPVKVTTRSVSGSPSITARFTA